MKHASLECVRPCRPLRAERLCPHAAFLPPDFTRYRAVSRQAREIFLRHMDEKGAASAVRFSPHYYNTEAEIDAAVEAAKALPAKAKHSWWPSWGLDVRSNRVLLATHGQWQQERIDFFQLNDEETIGFAPVWSDLGEKFVRSDADGGSQVKFGANLFANGAGHLCGGAECGLVLCDVEIGLRSGSPRLMLVMLVLLMSGCTLRVASEILAYQDYAAWAWNILPVSALIELTAVALFAVNLIATFARPPVVVASPLTMTTE
jgi:hypothetical protein